MTHPTKNFRTTALAIAGMSWPMLIGQLAGVGQGTVDTVMAGHYGADDLAAVGLGSSLFVSVYVAFMGLLQAVAPIVGQAYGAGERSNLGTHFRQGLWLALICGAIGFLVMWFPVTWLAWAKLTPVVEAKAHAFCRALAFEFPALTLLRVIQPFVQAVGRPKVMMLISLFMFLVNIPLNYIFMYGKLGLPELGGVGCGVASTLSAWLALGLAWTYLKRAEFFRQFNLFGTFEWPRWQEQRELLRVGLPMGMIYFVEVTSFTLMVVFIARLGSIVQGGHQIASNMSGVVYMLPLAIANASSVLVAHAVGAREFGRARYVGFVGIKLGILGAVLIATILLALRTQIAGLYTDDPAIRSIGAGLLLYIALYQFFDCFQCIAAGVLRGYKITMVPMLVFVIALWGVGLAGGYVLGMQGVDALDRIGLGAPMGAAGFWLASTIGLAVVALLLLPYVLWATNPRHHK